MGQLLLPRLAPGISYSESQFLECQKALPQIRVHGSQVGCGQSCAAHSRSSIMSPICTIPNQMPELKACACLKKLYEHSLAVGPIGC